ncbi:MAG TPA: hypothetical protein VGR38_02760, partial [Candidatus Polarisedimenticolia bacterium]|nr:hypothetical protein [Candidatus Polarisedimenticolia bacterium]
ALADPGAFSPPGEVHALWVDSPPGGGAVLSWASLAEQAGPGTVYDVAIGDLASLSGSGTAGSSTLDCGLSATTASDPSIPAPGTGAYYLVRGRNTCASGSWGENSQSAERFSLACP